MNETTQLVSRNETTQLCTAINRLQPPAPPLQQNRLFLPTDAKCTALIVRQWCLYNCSPNYENASSITLFSPVEHIWGDSDVKKKKNVTKINTKCEVKTIITEEWRKVDSEITKN
ncbi:hypothetical protein TNCV_4584701 [Trichonephila clavipes]|nr:hypothetical protein TNCV_4584701 [Trichonephila clavipes]